MILISLLGISYAKDALQASADYLRSAPAFLIQYSVKQHISFSDETKHQKGSLLFDLGGHFYLKSQNIEISLDDQEYREYRIPAKQILVKNAKNANILSPAQFLYKYLECPILSQQKKGNSLQLELNPKGKFKEAKTLTVWLNSQSFAPQRVRYTDSGNNSYEYTIGSLQAQKSAELSRFKIKEKAGIEVVDLK